jgi:hypothetical protein
VCTAQIPVSFFMIFQMVKKIQKKCILATIASGERKQRFSSSSFFNVNWIVSIYCPIVQGA